ncbi:ABC transporter ATP-binding protein [Anabaena cylindrica FACHB-243]|uniref:histidine kinase n=1 Tax=Anabaena cylindrica (strain ATCC 27899 / PCC 7122) TaxID=272123 RepID=K9ZHX0_ANACC|nr:MULTISPECIES: ABC transporter ATP-binding protein [Anabaena]AFZ58828.1 Xenobiotic-transporting ATPase [Anabaena cylindrica PCC 7122]MBD2416474.1 ABC transporter ATP-binding protein [Anabaena cylindrica FACHB-243]MBY5282574.1 ABC transporter ATP-binding protein [Anabaena sp. CCAP 1446/1C]MBY5307284.1 ABC transporter ATP-binding protein [Anabaena sp. CCAP 1446/1C]MCM2409453.1 ABC transporter ATP-binding protein/permease [Anabaena sp. CCAP 1446/1C]
MSTRKLLLRFAKPYPVLIVSTILLGFSGALFNGISTALIVPVILKIVGQNIDFKGAPGILKILLNPFDGVPENYRIAVMAVAVIGTIALKNLFAYISSLTSSSLTRMLTSDMREAGLSILLKVDIDYYTKMKVGDLMNRLGGEMSRASSAISNVVKLTTLSITILVFIGLLLSISWQLTIAATALMLVVTLLNQYFISRSKKFGKQLSELSKAYSIAVLEILNGIRLVKSTGNETREYQRIQKLIKDREKADFDSQANSQAIGPLSEFMGITCLLIIVFLSKTLFANQITAVSTVLLTYLLVLLRLLPLISQLNGLRSNFASTATSVEMVSEFLRLEDKPFMGNGKLPYKSLEKGVHFKSISFAYTGNKQQVLKDINLYLPCGTTLALVGGSGAGKSTLADLLPRFYDPTSGCITFDDVDLREFDLASVRKHMGIVSQDTFLFNDSVRNNIAYARPEATEEEIITAAQRANAYEFINKLPQQFDTLIGDRGVMLSGGQRQRLAIARALVQNPEILILDEATSALDTVSERLVQSALDELSQNRTTLVIAHRLSTVRKADQIAVLDQGRVVEVGTHEELLKKDGYYSQLCSMQFANNSDTSGKRNQSLLRISYEIRTQLNSMIGLMRLLIDDLVDDSQERQELLEESYKSAWRIINTVDVFDDVINKQIKGQLVSIAEQNRSGITTYYQNFTYLFDEFRSSLNPIFACLRTLADHVEEPIEFQNQLLNEAYESAIYLLGNLEKFEDNIKI